MARTRTQLQLRKIFVYGSAGTGKSHYIRNQIVARHSNHVILCYTNQLVNMHSAFGCRAQTIHSFFNINPVTGKIRHESRDARERAYANADVVSSTISSIDCIIIDECFIIDKSILDLICDGIARMKCVKTLYLVGDLHQNLNYSPTKHMYEPKIADQIQLPPKFMLANYKCLTHALYHSINHRLFRDITKSIKLTTQHRFTDNVPLDRLQQCCEFNSCDFAEFIDVDHRFSIDNMYIVSNFNQMEAIERLCFDGDVRSCGFADNVINYDDDADAGIKSIRLVGGLKYTLTRQYRFESTTFVVGTELIYRHFVDGLYVFSGVTRASAHTRMRTQSRTQSRNGIAVDCGRIFAHRSQHHQHSNIANIQKIQGVTRDFGWICVDNLFDVAYIYTSITRFRCGCKFFSLKWANDVDKINDLIRRYVSDYALARQFVEIMYRNQRLRV